MEDEELDAILQVLENPVRRRIVKRLSQGSSYPLQLAKELGLGQPLVAKHLALMEEAGVVTSSMEESPVGPERRKYSLAKSISITLDMAPNLFLQRGYSFSTIKGLGLSEGTNALMDLISRISGNDERAIASISKHLTELDRKLDEIEEERAALLFLRNKAMQTALKPILELESEEQKKVLHGILEKHTKSVKALSQSLNLREAVVRDILEELGSILG